jgi:glycosidase
VKDPIGRTGWPKEKGRDGERTPMQWDLDLKANGFKSARSLLATGKSEVRGEEVSLEPYGVFIGELTK